MPCGCVRPLAEVGYFSVIAPADNGIIALQLINSVAVVDNVRLAIKALARVVDSLQFIDSSHDFLPPKFYFCFSYLSIDIIAHFIQIVKKYFYYFFISFKLENEKILLNRQFEN